LLDAVRANRLVSSSSPVPPLAPAAPRIAPSASRISTPPICGKNFPCAVAASVMKKFGLSFARAASARLEAPMPTAAQALPVATSNRNMLAPSSRCIALRCPASSRTTTVTGLICISRAFCSALEMISFAFARLSVPILDSLVKMTGAAPRADSTDAASVAPQW
jgi:hypothetical protein